MCEIYIEKQMTATLKQLDEDINRKKRINAIYNQYIKATGSISELRLYEDPGEVEFVPTTTSVNVNYRNDLTDKLTKMMGMKNYEKVLDLSFFKESLILRRDDSLQFVAFINKKLYTKRKIGRSGNEN